jgi:hypothetical protein
VMQRVDDTAPSFALGTEDPWVQKRPKCERPNPGGCSAKESAAIEPRSE